MENTLKIVGREEVAARLKAAREALGLRQVDAATQAGKPQQIVSQWEAGAVPEGAVDVTRLGVVLGLSPNELYLEGSDTRLRGHAKGLLPASEEPAALSLLVELSELTKLAGLGMVELFRSHAAGLRASFEAQLAGRAPWSAESGARLPSQEEVDQLAGNLTELALGGLAERPEALLAADVAKRLGLLAALLPPGEDAGAPPRSEAAGPAGAAAGSGSPERAAGPRKKASSSPRKKK